MQSIMKSLSTHLDHLDWEETAPGPPHVKEQGLQLVHSNSDNNIKIMLCHF